RQMRRLVNWWRRDMLERCNFIRPAARREPPGPAFGRPGGRLPTLRDQTLPSRNSPQTSFPRLSQASTFSVRRPGKPSVDGRNEPGHNSVKCGPDYAKLTEPAERSGWLHPATVPNVPTWIGY